MAKDIVSRETYVTGDGTEVKGSTLLGRLYTTLKGAENQLARDAAWLVEGGSVGRVVSVRDSEDNRWYSVLVTPVDGRTGQPFPVEPVPANRITFDVERGDDGSRELFIAGTGILVGWIESGRAMIDFNGRRWTEWAFIPVVRGTDEPKAIVHESISAAYDEARAYAATLVAAP